VLWTLSEGEFPSVRVKGGLSCPAVEYHPENLSKFSSEPLFENPSKYTSKRTSEVPFRAPKHGPK
jgi:hypothetical protein